MVYTNLHAPASLEAAGHGRAHYRKGAATASHPLMQQEQRREEENMRFLSVLPEKFGEAISALRARAVPRLFCLSPAKGYESALPFALFRKCG